MNPPLLRRRPAVRRPSVARITAVLAAAVVAGACSSQGGMVTFSTSAAPGASASTGCLAAPTPPAGQTGWTTAPSEPSVFPLIVNSSGSLTCGENRLLFTFLDAANVPVAKPDRTVSAALFDLGRDGGTPAITVDGTFVWGIENERGFYTATVSFPEAGVWGAEFTTAVAGSAPEKVRMTFDVATSSPVIRVGQRAPASDTPTAASAGGDLARISTDQHPDPAFYQASVKDALAAHDPFVLIFATPKFCISAQCGPTLDRLKPLAAEFPGVTFIHVEPYELTFQDGGLQAVRGAGGALVPTKAVLQWGLLSEPWVFVVDRTGVVTASFEGVLGTDELRAAANAVK